MQQPVVTITRRGADRARSGHLWIYRSDVSDASAATGGAVVRVTDERGRFVGQALYSDRSEIALRLLTWRNELIDRAWWRTRLRAAIARRKGLERDADAFRLVYAEGDLLPSLIVDRYADVLVLQTLAQGTEAIKDLLVELLVEELSPRAIVERNDVRVRRLEGLELRAGVLYGDAPAELEIVQHGIRFTVAPLAGQKTGAFLDQRENHVAARTYAKNRASVAAAARGYKEINLRALKLLDAGGVLITCTCSYHMTEQMFQEMLISAAADARRRVQLVERRIQARDHPVLVGVPETLY